MRLPWVREHTIINHTIWATRSPKPEYIARTLASQPEYDRAKRRHDYNAAFAIVERLMSPEALKMISKKLDTGRFDADPYLPRPIVVAPVKLGNLSKNLLPVACAHLTAYRLGLGVCRDIYQVDNASRTGKSAISRLLNQPEFKGAVQKGREYVIVDDVYTSGGSVAALASYIEAQGGKVSCISVLATPSKEKLSIKDKFTPREHPLSITAGTLDEIQSTHGWNFGSKFEKAVGMPLEALTHREGTFVAHGFDGPRAFLRAVESERRECESAANSRAGRPPCRGGTVLEGKPT